MEYAQPYPCKLFFTSTITRLLQDHGFEVLKIRSSIELKLLLMYVIYPRKRKNRALLIRSVLMTGSTISIK